MATKIVPNSNHLEKSNYNGAICERKVIGFSHENGPVKPYSSVFYWSHMSSNFGSVISEHPHIGFEMITYVVKGSFETFDKEKNEWMELHAGDVSLVQAGKGICHTEKINPRSEVLQIWFDPNYEQFRKLNPVFRHYKAESFPISRKEGRKTHLISGDNAPVHLNSRNVSLELTEFSAGFHTIYCPEDAILSGYVLDGFIDIAETTLAKGDFFRIDECGETQIASLVNSKVFLTVSPYHPEYQTFSESNLSDKHHQ